MKEKTKKNEKKNNFTFFRKKMKRNRKNEKYYEFEKINDHF